MLLALPLFFTELSFGCPTSVDNTMTEDVILDSSSPFYLGSSDQPDNFITHVILIYENYVG